MSRCPPRGESKLRADFIQAFCFGMMQANIHAFLESDDRIQSVLKGIDDAIAEMDEMDTRITGYKMQLGVS